jgi:hypothetical protein
MIGLSMALMLVVLGTLMAISVVLRREKATTAESLLVKVPFGVYFGWITVATIANATTLLVDLGWNRFGLSEGFWMVAILVVGTLIAGATTVVNRDVAYGLVPVWAYFGIVLKRSSDTTYGDVNATVVLVAWICIAALAIALASVLLGGRKAAATGGGR